MIYAQPKLIFTTAGTGTIDVGTSTGGTGTSQDWINGGTMALGVLVPSNHADAASGSAGGNGNWVPMGASGAAGDSLTVNTVGATGTYAGFVAVEYFIV